MWHLFFAAILIFHFTVECATILPWFKQEQFLLKINSGNYDEHLIYQKLQQAYENMYALPNNHHAKLYLGDIDKFKQCIVGTEIRYYIKSFEMVQKESEASECRINVNPEYEVIITPSENSEVILHETSDIISKHLENRIIEKFNLLQIPVFSAIEFYDFDNLNYDLQCSLDYQDIGQIKLVENDLRMTLHEIFDIPENCGFQRIDKEFTGEFKQIIVVDIPVNGTFVCHRGSSRTCKKSLAEFSNPKYKLFRDT
ncbi:hypothetical protein CLIB1444_02S06656 [[Candida] jaroonii]|uniref:Uncharacterized protein n=1 Tax=[Candida] jaroonii TaxID=467808 RepID=A0ACA9Y337_9ASCO|nr:hypothetical protein CLIB1444_02S06656 [[Candida] jaroonii]